MALVVKDRVKETTATTGTGTLTLAGAMAGFQAFSAALSDGDTTYYALFESSTGEWEVGLGTFALGSTTLARTTILASSNAGSAINLTAGSAEVFITQPAGKTVVFDAAGGLTLNQDPTGNLQAATKQYVDTIAAAGLHYHDPVRVEEPTALTVTYNNGTAGVGATLTNAGTQAALVLDGVTMNVADRVLIYVQADATQNGIYTVTNVGSVSTNWVLTRATDADSYGPSDPDSLGQGDAFFVLEGNTGAGELYVMNTEGTITFGTTNITFTQVASTAVYSAGNGLTLTGTTFAVGAGTGVTVNANDVSIGQDVSASADVTFNTVTASLLGNATTATTASGVTANSVALGTDTTGNYVAAGAVSGSGLSGSASSEGATFTVTSNATNANTPSTIVFRDASGNFSAGTITANLSGNAATATTATTANGVAANSVALGTDTTGNYVATIATSAGLDGSGSSEGAAVTLSLNLSELTTSTANGDGDYFVVVDTANAQKKLTKGNINISGFNNDAGYTTNVGDITGVTAGSFITGGGTSGTVTINVDATSANTASKVVARDGSGNFSAGTITASLTGNASTASTLQTSRNIALTGAVTGNANFNGGGNISITTTATSDPTLTLAGDATGSATFTNLGNATLTVAVVDNSHNHSISTITDEYRLFNNMGDNHSTRTDFNATYDFGWRFVQGATNGPLTGSQYYSTYVGLGNDYDYTQYGMQIAYPRNVGTPYISIRYKEATVWGSWQKISAGYAENAGLLDNLDSSQFLRSDAADSTASTISFTGDIEVGDQILHHGDTDTYMQFHAANQWRVVTGGVERIEASSSGIRIDDAYTLPTTDGLAGQFLQTNGSGTLTFADAGGGGEAYEQLWVRKDVNTASGLNCVAGDGSGKWIALGDSGTAATSSDNGSTWSVSTIAAAGSQQLLDVATDGAGKWMGVGRNGTVIYSSNNGSTWTQLTIPGMTYELNGVATDGIGTWMAVGQYGYHFRSTDNGSTWTQLSAAGGYSNDIRGIRYGNGVWVLFNSGNALLRSTNNGTTYTYAVGANTQNKALATDGAGNWLAGQDAGGIWRSTDNAATWAYSKTRWDFSGVNTPTSIGGSGDGVMIVNRARSDSFDAAGMTLLIFKNSVEVGTAVANSGNLNGWRCLASDGAATWVGVGNSGAIGVAQG
jgi:hypothetical protein